MGSDDVFGITYTMQYFIDALEGNFEDFEPVNKLDIGKSAAIDQVLFANLLLATYR